MCLSPDFSWPRAPFRPSARRRSPGIAIGVRYEKRYRDPVLKSMEHDADSLNALNDSVSAAIQKECRGRDKKRSADKKVIRFDWSGIEKPRFRRGLQGPVPFSAPPAVPHEHVLELLDDFGSRIRIKRLSGRRSSSPKCHTVYWELRREGAGPIAMGVTVRRPGSNSDAVSIIWEELIRASGCAYLSRAGPDTTIRTRTHE